ncbi:MAG TPA: hypothetical protein VMU89_17185 [Thermomicrobiaceae bacterium]|nr:hypothetical protein [Thermomicrobiaceae bacterium]
MNVRAARAVQSPLARRLAYPAGLVVLLVLAAGSRLLRLDRLPTGLPDAAAANGVLARAIAGQGAAGPIVIGDRSLPLAALVALVGRVAGFGADAPGLGTALAGIASALLVGLWLRRAVGPAWGIAGGLALAGSFWPLLFDRIGLSPAMGAAALAALLCCLAEARVRPPQAALPWYALAGVAAAIGFAADATLRVMPALLVVVLIAAAWEARVPGRGARSTRGDLAGPTLMLVVALLAGLPFVLARWSDPALLAFWGVTPGTGGHLPAGALDALGGFGAALARLVWPGAVDPALNLPGDPLFAPWLAPWALLGLAVALRQLRRTEVAAALVWGLLLLVPAALSQPVGPARLVPALPLLIALPVLGMAAVVGRVRCWRGGASVAVALVVLTLIGNGAWTGWRYVGVWAPSPATADALGASVVEALQAVDRLPAGDPVEFSIVGHAGVVDYLGADQPTRQDFDGSRVLPVPSDGDGWLVVPQATPVDPALLQLLNGIPPYAIGRDASGRERYRVYRLDSRVRGRVPFSVPTTQFADGALFEGVQVYPGGKGSAAVVTAWQIPAGAGPPRVRVRLGLSGTRGTIAETTLPPTAPGRPTYLLALSVVTVPGTSDPVDLGVSLLDASGRPVAAPGLGTDGYLSAGTYRFSR